jgi:hypothetical protein
MSALILLPPDLRPTPPPERSLRQPNDARHGERRDEAVRSGRSDDELWPWVLLPDGALELSADVA